MQFSVMDACAGYTRKHWLLEPPCSMILISGAPDSLEPHSLRTVNEVKVDDEKLNAVLKFCYLGGMLCF